MLAPMPSASRAAVLASILMGDSFLLRSRPVDYKSSKTGSIMDQEGGKARTRSRIYSARSAEEACGTDELNFEPFSHVAKRRVPLRDTAKRSFLLRGRNG